ncbi:MAG: hypothetical protein EOM20_13630 [Spartobacteria bacterium]|nr:hypothetical protein [Spartobacteria bacterium]
MAAEARHTQNKKNFNTFNTHVHNSDSPSTRHGPQQKPVAAFQRIFPILSILSHIIPQKSNLIPGEMVFFARRKQIIAHCAAFYLAPRAYVA